MPDKNTQETIHKLNTDLSTELAALKERLAQLLVEQEKMIQQNSPDSLQKSQQALIQHYEERITKTERIQEKLRTKQQKSDPTKLKALYKLSKDVTALKTYQDAYKKKQNEALKELMHAREEALEKAKQLRKTTAQSEKLSATWEKLSAAMDAQEIRNAHLDINQHERRVLTIDAWGKLNKQKENLATLVKNTTPQNIDHTLQQLAKLTKDYQQYKRVFYAAEQARRQESEVNHILTDIISTIDTEIASGRLTGQSKTEWEDWRQDVQKLQASYQDLHFPEPARQFLKKSPASHADKVLAHRILMLCPNPATLAAKHDLSSYYGRFLHKIHEILVALKPYIQRSNQNTFTLFAAAPSARKIHDLEKQLEKIDKKPEQKQPRG